MHNRIDGHDIQFVPWKSRMQETSLVDAIQSNYMAATKPAALASATATTTTTTRVHYEQEYIMANETFLPLIDFKDFLK